MAHRAGGRDISNKCYFAACACDRPGPDKLWSMSDMQHIPAGYCKT